MQSVGKKMGLYISTPIAAAAAMAGAALGGMAGQAKEIQKAAQLAATSTTQIQQMSHATKSVGIETEKLGDILKDTNDKFGDYFQTGGGAAADFFENIAPKVGLTADAFRDLSGPDALQAYYNALEQAGLSHAEIVFYMEAIASDSALLIPLLKENGKAMKELGEGAATLSDADISALQAWNNALAQLQAAVQQVMIALVNSGVVQWFADTAKAAAKWVQEFAKTNPEIIKWVAIIAGVAAAIGPVLVVLGSLTVVLAGISAPVLAAVAAFAALAAAGVALYTNWDSFKASFPGVASVIQMSVESIKQYFLGLFEVGKQVFSGIDALLRGDFAGGLEAARGAAQAWGEMLVNIINTFIPGFKEGVQQVIQSVREMGSQMLQILQALPGQMLEIGKQIIQGLINGISSGAGMVADAAANLGSSIYNSIASRLGIHSPSRVMHEVGNNVVQGLNNGMGELKGDTQSLASSIGSTISSAFQGVIDGSKSVGDALKDLLKQLASTWANQAFQALFGEGGLNIGGGSSGGGGIGSMLSGLFGKLFGFARGGSFKVGSSNGLSGVDSQLVAFRASPNETVSITRPDQERGYANGQTNVSVNVINNAGANVSTNTNSDGSMDIVIDKMIADKLGTRGTAANTVARKSGWQQPLRRISN